jgi:DNA-directed RNA polymerase subunit RPC12/RpoP
MYEKLERSEKSFLVQCIWCGAKIREDSEQEAEGVCMKCFYQILDNHLQAQNHAVYGEFVSDR